MKNAVYSVCLLVSLTASCAFGSSFSNHEKEVTPAIPKFEQELTFSTATEEPQQTIEISDQQLAANPDLLQQFLNLAVDQQQFEVIPELVAMYQNHPNHDTVLVKYALGAFYHSQKNYTQAIRLYQHLINEVPELQKIRFKLAQWLFEDKQFRAAQQQFTQLEPQNVPPFITQRVKQYQAALEEREAFDLSFGVNYLHDDNLNNASSIKHFSFLGKTFEKSPQSLPQKGRGLGYHVALSKSLNLISHHNLQLENQLSGKYYWNNKAYNDTENRFSLGYKFQNAHRRLSLLPFYEKRWFAQKQYSDDWGVRVEGDSRISHKWQLSSAFEYAKTEYNRQTKKRYKQLYSNTLTHLVSARTHLHIGADVLLERAALKNEKSDKYTIRLGWQERWNNGIISRANLYFGRRLFQGKDNLTDKKRQDNEWGGTLTLAKTNWQLWGILPKVQYRYQKVDSNIPEFYTFDKHQLILLFDKSF